MAQLIDKAALVAEIEKKRNETADSSPYLCGKKYAYKNVLEFINSLEMKEVDNWHLQSKEDIDNVLVDWGLHTFVCLMKDGTIQKFSGIQDECYNGTINKHLNCVDDNYEWEYDDIVYWIETPIIKAQKG